MGFQKAKYPNGFNSPNAVPDGDEQGRIWQDANQEWWQQHPMRYDWKKEIFYPEFSREFFEEVDRRFYHTAYQYLPWKEIPFDSLIDFKSLSTKDVLEIGIGMGSHAQLLAQHAHSYTGVDITEYAIVSTNERFKCFGLLGEIHQIDAERMYFSNDSFDFVWSWGVIHHSSDTRKILKEIHRVLRPNGIAIIMVYYRGMWMYYICNGFFVGILRGDLFRSGSLHNIVQKRTDGAIARYYSKRDWRNEVMELFSIEDLFVTGNKSEILPIPGGRIKSMLLALIPDSLSRFMTNNCRMGSMLVAKMRKTPEQYAIPV